MKTYYLQFGSGDPRALGGMRATFLLFKTTDGTNITAPGITEIPTSTGIHYFNWGTTTSISFLADAATTSPGAASRYVVGALDPVDRMDEYGNTLIAIGTSNVALGTTSVALGTSNIAQGVSIFALGTSNIAQGVSIFALGNSIFAQGVSIFALGNSIFAQGSSNYAFDQNMGSTIVGIGNSLIYGLSIIGTVGSTFGGTSTDPVDLFGYLKRIQENLEGDQNFIKTSGLLTIYNRGSSYTLRTKTITNSVSTVIKV